MVGGLHITRLSHCWELRRKTWLLAMNKITKMKITNELRRAVQNETAQQAEARKEQIKTEVSQWEHEDAIQALKIAAQRTLGMKFFENCLCKKCEEQLDCTKEGTHEHQLIIGSCCGI